MEPSFSCKMHFTTASCMVVLLLGLLGREAECSQEIEVGGTWGWTNKADIDYTQWLSKYSIKIGDKLNFRNFDTTDHSFIEVDKQGFEKCDITRQTGGGLIISPDTGMQVTVDGGGPTGTRYAICSMPSHCLQGMKVSFVVHNSDGTINKSSPPSPRGTSAAPVHKSSSISGLAQLLIVLVVTFYLVLAAPTVAAS